PGLVGRISKSVLFGRTDLEIRPTVQRPSSSCAAAWPYSRIGRPKSKLESDEGQDVTPNPEAAVPMDIEQPACFYLGREYDLANRRPLDRPVMLDARDLTTHGVIVGMTGSGKTGLGISLLEEAAIDGIPCVVIDPK